jgi:hypothetical protein
MVGTTIIHTIVTIIATVIVLGAIVGQDGEGKEITGTIIFMW